MNLFRILCAVLIAFCLVGVGAANAASSQHAKTQAVLTQLVDINAADVHRSDCCQTCAMIFHREQACLFPINMLIYINFFMRNKIW